MSQSRWRLRFSELTKWYQRIAILVFNFLILFVIMNMMLSFLVPRPDSRSYFSTPPLTVYSLGPWESYSFDSFRAAYPSRTDAEIIQLVLENWNIPLQCDEASLYREMPFFGSYVNVDLAGFRWGAEQAPWPPPADAITIFVFGGSTTFGYGESDANTIPSHLQQALRQLEGHDDINVYNFGRSFYFSLQERIAFESLIDDGHVPDIAIFIDGLNDFYHWDGQPTVRPCQPNPTDFSTRLQNTLQCHPDTICLPLQRLSLGTAETSEPATALMPALDDEEVNQAVVDRYLQNKAMINASAQQHNISTLFVMQPVPCFAYDLTYHPFLDDCDGTSRHFRSQYGYPLFDSVVTEPDVLDLRFLSEQSSDVLYVDQVHYTGDFMQRIAEDIALYVSAISSTMNNYDE